MTQYLPQDMGQWMRQQEKRIQALERRRIPSDAWIASPFVKNIPRFWARLSGGTSITAATPTEIGYTSLFGAPYVDGWQDFMTHGLVGTQYRYTMTVAGLYFVSASLQWSNAVSGSGKLHMLLDNNNQPTETSWITGSPDSQAFRCRIQCIIPLNVGQSIRFAAQTVAVNRAVLATGSGMSGANGHSDSTLAIMPYGAYDYVSQA